MALAPELTRAAPAMLSRITPEPRRSRPVPKAEAEPTLTEPSETFRPPAPLPAPVSARRPAPALVTGALKVTPPERVSEVPLRPAPATVQDWTPWVVSGAEMRIAPASAFTSMPLLELPG